MEPKINLLQTVDYSILEKNFLQVSRPDGFSLLPKSYPRFLPKILAKVISWWRFPDLRVAAVCNAFSKCIETTTTQVLGELSNLYIHARNFNRRVIEKHNKTWIFWARVPLLNLTTLEEGIRNELQTTLDSIQKNRDETALKAAIEALESIADPSLLPFELRLLHSRLDTACQIYSFEQAEKVNEQFNLTQLEERIRTVLQTTLDSLQKNRDDKALKAAIDALESIADPSLLPIELRLLHARLDTACEIYSYEQAEKIDDQLEELKKLDTWNGNHIEKLTYIIPRTVALFVQKDESAPISKVKFHMKTWQALQKKVADMHEDSNIKKIITEPAMRKLDEMVETVCGLEERLRQARSINMASVCAEITSLSLSDVLDAFINFLPENSEVAGKIQKVKNKFAAIKELATGYPAHETELEEYRKIAQEEIRSREEAFENYGLIATKGLVQRSTEFITSLRIKFMNDDPLPFVKEYLDEIRVLQDVQGLCFNAQSLLGLRQVPADAVKAVSKLVEVKDLISRRYEKAESQVPKLYNKWKALRDEVEALWEPVRKTQQDISSNDG